MSSESIKISNGISQLSGWGHLEYDEFRRPFQWIGAEAGLSISAKAGESHLYVHGGSPEFKGKRRMSLSLPGRELHQELKPGWHVYHFPLGDNPANSPHPATIHLHIDRMIDAEGDTRDLGLMVDELLLADRQFDALYWLVHYRKRNVQSRSHYYADAGRPGILWLASYPRSGNTWMRFLLTNLLFETVENSSQIADYIDEDIDPPYYRREDKGRQLTIFGSQAVHIMKTHLPLTFEMPMYGQSQAAIYIVRHPMDVAVSLYKWTGHSEKNLEWFLQYGGTPQMIMRGAGTWQSHVCGWLKTSTLFKVFPIYLIRYESLQCDPLQTLRGLLQWLQIERSDEQIRLAIEQSSLSNLKRMEERERNARNPGIFYVAEKQQREQDWQFLRDGKANVYGTHLNESQIALGQRTFSAMMEELGYR